MVPLSSIRASGLNRDLQSLHRRDCISFNALDVNFTGRLYAAVTEDRLDRLVVHAEAMQVGCETAAEGVPPSPPLPMSREDRFDVTFRERVEIERLAIPGAFEDEAFLRIPALLTVISEDLLKCGDHGARTDQANHRWVPPMRQLLITAFKDALDQIKAEVAFMPLTRLNESVFRFMYSRAVATRERDVTHFVECSKIDLVLHSKGKRAFVEFKFYTHSTAYDPLSGIKTRMKGFPSAKNRQEFERCVETLRGRSVPPEVLKLVALFYADPVSTTKKTYESYYGDSSGVEDELNIRRLVSIPPFLSNGAQSNCNARLYEVGS